MSSDIKFNMDLKKGKIGEVTIESFLAENNYNSIKMVDDEIARMADVDYIVFPQQYTSDYINTSWPETFTVEVKTDQHIAITGNLYIETRNNNYTGKGWLYTCQADYMAFCTKYKDNKICYFCDFRKLKNYCLKQYINPFKNKLLVSIEKLREEKDIIIWSGIISDSYNNEFQKAINKSLCELKIIKKKEDHEYFIKWLEKEIDRKLDNA